MSNQTFKVQGVLEIQLPFNPTSDLVRGRISFTDSLNKSLASLRVFGTTQPRLIVDSVGLANGIAFRASTDQGTTTEGGKGQVYGLEVLNTGITARSVSIRQDDEIVNPDDNVGTPIFTGSRWSNINPTVGVDTYIGYLMQSVFKNNEKIQFGIGGTNSRFVFGYEHFDSPLFPEGYLAYKSSTYSLPVVNMRLTTTGDVVIPTKLKATTIEATNWIGLPATPPPDVLPLTLDATNGFVGVNTTNPPTCALDVVGDVKISGQVETQQDLQVAGDITSLGTITATTYVGLPPPQVAPITLDTTNNRVGINQTTPTEALDVTGDIQASDEIRATTIKATTSMKVGLPGMEEFVLTTSDLDPLKLNATLGRVGINTISPTRSLHVEGDTFMSGKLDVNGPVGMPDTLTVGTVNAGTYLNLPLSNVLPLTLDTTNNRVGINKTTPNEALDVVGNIHATGGVDAPTVSGVNTFFSGTMTAFTVDAGTYLNLPAPDVLPLTLDTTNNRVGINNTSPAYNLHVTGTGGFSGNVNAATFSMGAAPTPTIRGVDGSPEGVTTANPGSLALRRDGAIGTSLYTKVSGTGNTGWQAIGGTPQIGSTVLAKLGVNKEVAPTATEIINFVLPYIGTYEIVVGHRVTSGYAGAFVIAKTLTTTGSYPSAVRIPLSSQGNFIASTQAFATILYTTTTAGLTYYLNASSAQTTTMIATETQIVATYKGMLP